MQHCVGEASPLCLRGRGRLANGSPAWSQQKPFNTQSLEELSFNSLPQWTQCNCQKVRIARLPQRCPKPKQHQKHEVQKFKGSLVFYNPSVRFQIAVKRRGHLLHTKCPAENVRGYDPMYLAGPMGKIQYSRWTNSCTS